MNNFKGKEIRLKRNVDLASYNDYEIEAKSLDWTVRTDSENKEFDIATYRILKAYADRFILQATEYGISRYERMLGIEAKEEETLADRRKRVYFLWNRQVIWTDRTIREWLDNYLGKNKYNLELEYDKYNFILSVLVNNPNLNNSWLAKNLRQIIPANLIIDIRILMKEKIIYYDKCNSYLTKFWITNQIPSGRVPSQSYHGIKSRDTLRMGSSGRISDNKPYKTNEIRANNTPNKGGNR